MLTAFSASYESEFQPKGEPPQALIVVVGPVSARQVGMTDVSLAEKRMHIRESVDNSGTVLATLPPHLSCVLSPSSLRN